jgi:hypothetical protein
MQKKGFWRRGNGVDSDILIAPKILHLLITQKIWLIVEAV